MSICRRSERSGRVGQFPERRPASIIGQSAESGRRGPGVHEADAALNSLKEFPALPGRKAARVAVEAYGYRVRANQNRPRLAVQGREPGYESAEVREGFPVMAK